MIRTLIRTIYRIYKLGRISISVTLCLKNKETFEGARARIQDTYQNTRIHQKYSV